MTEIIENLFLGDCHTARDLAFLKRHNITHILCIASELKPKFPGKFVYKMFNVSNHPGFKICSILDKSCNYIYDCLKRAPTIPSEYYSKKEKESSISMTSFPLMNRMLVHCSDGNSRSATVILAYLIKFKRMNLKTAYSFLKRKRKY